MVFFRDCGGCGHGAFNNFHFAVRANNGLIAAMRLVWMTALAVGLGEGAFAVAAPVPGEHAWARDGAYVYRVRVESQEAKYLPSLRGEVVYLCRAANPHGFTLRCHNFLTLQRHSNEGRRFPPFGVFQLGWKFFDGSSVGRVPRPPVDVVFDTRGKRLVRAGAPARDFDLTDPSLLVVHRFAPKGTNEWTVTEQVRLVHEQRFVRAGEEGFVRIKKTPLIGTLRIKYHREAEELAQSLILETPNTPGQPRIRLAGKGTTTFSASGIPVKFSWEGKLTDHNGQTERTLPVTIHYELLTGKHPFGDAYHKCVSERDFARLNYTPAYRINPLVPVWLDGAIHRALSIDPALRYPALSEFAQDIQRPNPAYESARPLFANASRSVWFWQMVAGGLLLVNLVTLLVLL